ncbi:hypothetical protein MaudCBS49596_004398 [Microsporum audouinii]
MRTEILQHDVMEKYRVSSTIAAMQVRGHDLSIKVDHEIGHVNFAVKTDAATEYNAEKEVVGWQHYNWATTRYPEARATSTRLRNSSAGLIASVSMVTSL